MLAMQIFVGYGFRHSSNGNSNGVTAPLILDPAATDGRCTTQDSDSDDSADADEGRITQETDTDNNEQGGTREETNANARSELVPSGKN